MTTTKSASVDHLDRSLSHDLREPLIARGSDDHGAHLLRLVLDLQLDALLLGLGAAAVQESRGHPAPPQPVADTADAPWPRWAMEDVDLARTLAAEAVTSGAALPATLGPEPAGQEERVVLDRLAARYESMQDLLTDLLARAGSDRVGGLSQLHSLMAHCRRRLFELHTLADSRRASASSTGTHPGDHAYLPGELLG